MSGNRSIEDLTREMIRRLAELKSRLELYQEKVGKAVAEDA
jgi:hypothetical protein